MTESKRSQNPKRPLLLLPLPCGYNIYDNALNCSFLARSTRNKTWKSDPSSADLARSAIGIPGAAGLPECPARVNCDAACPLVPRGTLHVQHSLPYWVQAPGALRSPRHPQYRPHDWSSPRYPHSFRRLHGEQGSSFSSSFKPLSRCQPGRAAETSPFAPWRRNVRCASAVCFHC